MRNLPLISVLVGAAAFAAVLVLVGERIEEPLLIAVENTTPASGEKPRAVSLLFVGDIMLDRGVALHAKRYGAERLFAGVSELFSGKDAVIGNLEGTITDEPSIAIASSSILRFTFEPQYADFLKKVGISALSLANNHALDFGAEGYQQTVSYLDAATIASFGSPLNAGRLSAKLQLPDSHLCLVGYHALFHPDLESVLAEAERLRPECSLLVVSAHWGEEYQHEPAESQRVAARAFIDAGADLVIGAHPHVVQPLEIYRGKAIFYSLGNFIFDQDFSPETMRGLAVEVAIHARELRFTLHPVSIQGGEVSEARNEARSAVFAEVLSPRLPPGIAASIEEIGFFALSR